MAGIREGTGLRRSGGRLVLGGESTGARLFRRHEAPQERAGGTDLGFLLG